MNKTILMRLVLLVFGVFVLVYINLAGCSESNRQVPNMGKGSAIEKQIADEDPFAQKDDSMEAPPHRLREDMTQPARIGSEENV